MRIGCDVACCRVLCGDWFEYESQRGGVAGYKTQPLGMCSIVLDNKLEIPITLWHQQVKSSLPAASNTYPPRVGRYSDDTWEHWTISESHDTSHSAHASPLNAAILQVCTGVCEKPTPNGQLNR